VLIRRVHSRRSRDGSAGCSSGSSSGTRSEERKTTFLGVPPVSAFQRFSVPLEFLRNHSGTTPEPLPEPPLEHLL
jgi:hypothetical protein